MALATELRRAGLAADLDLAGRSTKGQMKQADRLGARHALILDEDGSAKVRDMASGEQREVELERIVEELSVSGFPALRPNGYRDTWCGQVLADRVDEPARVAGWVHRRRDHGGLVFIDLRDRTGLVQLVFNPDEAGEAFELGHGCAPRTCSAWRARSCAAVPRR